MPKITTPTPSLPVRLLALAAHEVDLMATLTDEERRMVAGIARRLSAIGRG